MRVERTKDYELVRHIITHPRVYPWVVDDGSPAADQYRAVESDAIFYILIDGKGVFAFIPENAATVQIHTCLTPALWGRSVDAAKAAIAWMFENTPYRRVTTTVPEDNKLAQRLALRVGLTEYGRNHRSWLKGGVLLDQILYGLNKE